MPPSKDPARLAAIVDAATELFARQGFDATQVVDVAAAAGVSVGTVYGYVGGKDVLLLLAAERPFLDVAAGRELPVTIADRAEMVSRLDDLLDVHVRVPALEDALAGAWVAPHAEAVVDAVVGELFDLMARTRAAADAMERSAREAPDLGALFYRHARGRLLDQLTRLCARIDSGSPLPTPLTPDRAGRAVLETVTWWARHRHRDPAPPDLGDDEARAVATTIVRRLLLP